MNGCNECKSVSRRNFLSKLGLGAGALALGDPLLRNVAATYAQSAGGTGNILVLCQLAGGMDALSFLAPFTNSEYIRRRPGLALPASAVTPLPDAPEYGINNQWQFFNELYAQRHLAIVQQVGYPRENGSHFESQDIYEFGVRNLGSASGTSATWYERLRRSYFNEPFGVLDTRVIGDPRNFGYPDTTYHKAAQDAFGRLARLKQGGSPNQQAVRETYARIDTTSREIQSRTRNFTSTGPARGEFFRAAALASADLGTQILKVTYGGFDTHASQAQANAQLFPQISEEFRQFVGDMQALGLWNRTTVVFYTEFGRRNEENGSPGTDHGYGCHMMLAGPRVNGGLHGQRVTTADIAEDSLPYYTDFRAVFGSCIRDWLGFDANPIFNLEGETYEQNVGSSLFV